jgi:23S rRNA pseudouridine955/2504/2580 synthase
MSASQPINPGATRPAATDTGVQTVRIDAEHDGQRLDNFLLACFRQVPKARVYRSVRSGEVRVNKGRSRQGYRLREGDMVRLPPLNRNVAPGRAAAPGTELTRLLDAAVLFEDEHLLVLNKPSGLAVHGGSGQSHGLIESMRAIRTQQKFLELVHRLDRATSGVLVLAKRRTALVGLHGALRDGEVDKRYLSLLKGQWRGGGRRVEHALRRSSGRNGERMMLVDAAGQRSITAFTPLSVASTASLMRVRPHTGRTHQIRVHAAAVRMPIAGDERYGDREFNREMQKHGLNRLFLHASSLQVYAPLPDDLAQVLAQLGLEYTVAHDDEHRPYKPELASKVEIAHENAGSDDQTSRKSRVKGDE